MAVGTPVCFNEGFTGSVSMIEGAIAANLLIEWNRVGDETRRLLSALQTRQSRACLQ